MADLRKTATKLMNALIHAKGYNLVMGNKPFIAKEGFSINMWTVSQGLFDADKNKYINKELFCSSSMTQVVFYLRDAWFLANGDELPNDNPQWVNIREGLMRDGKYGPFCVPEVKNGERQ